MACCSASVDAGETKKAKGASIVALLKPIPSFLLFVFVFVFCFRPLAQGQRLVNSKLVDWLKWRF